MVSSGTEVYLWAQVPGEIQLLVEAEALQCSNFQPKSPGVFPGRVENLHG